jgi:hypothetical protein
MFNLHSVTDNQQKSVQYKTKEHCITLHLIRVTLYTKGGKLLGERPAFATHWVIQEESAVFWEMIVCVILSKKVHMNMGPILNGY